MSKRGDGNALSKVAVSERKQTKLLLLEKEVSGPLTPRSEYVHFVREADLSVTKSSPINLRFRLIAFYEKAVI